MLVVASHIPSLSLLPFIHATSQLPMKISVTFSTEPRDCACAVLYTLRASVTWCVVGDDRNRSLFSCGVIFLWFIRFNFSVVTMTNPKVYREQPVFPSQESDQSMINSQESANLSMLDSGFVSVLQIHVRVEHEIFTERQKVRT